MKGRTFVISGTWSYGKPDYTLWELVPKPRFPDPEWTPDDCWRSRKLPKEEMKRGDIFPYLNETYGEGCNMKVMEFRTDGQQVFVIFTPIIV